MTDKPAAPPYMWPNPEGNYCAHHPDDPAHGSWCARPAAPAPDDWVGEAENLPEPLGLPPGDPTLPMLPEPRLVRKESSDTTGTWVTQSVAYFTAGQVTDYARAAIERIVRERDERETLRKNCEQAWNEVDEIAKHRDALGVALNKRENDLMEALNALGQILTMADRAIGCSPSEQDDYLAKISDLARKVALK